MEGLEALVWRDDRLAGVAYSSVGVFGAAGLGLLVDVLPFGPVAAGYVAIAGRGLWSAAAQVADALASGDLESARTSLPSLVGRDREHLDEAEVARAVVESVAENTVDAIVAPAIALALGGAAGVLSYRAVNTLDAMVGHRSDRYERFGWASARTDDFANLVPARCTAALVACLRPRASRAILHAVRHEAPAHPSPNAGVAESAFAAALGVRLGGESRYGRRVESRPHLNAVAGRGPVTEEIYAAIRLSQQVTLLLGALLAGLGLMRRSRGSHRRHG